MIYQKTSKGAVGNNKVYWQTFEYMPVLSKGEPKAINFIIGRKNKDARDGDISNKRIFDGSLQAIKHKD